MEARSHRSCRRTRKPWGPTTPFQVPLALQILGDTLVLRNLLLDQETQVLALAPPRARYLIKSCPSVGLGLFIHKQGGWRSSQQFFPALMSYEIRPRVLSHSLYITMKRGHNGQRKRLGPLEVRSQLYNYIQTQVFPGCEIIPFFTAFFSLLFSPISSSSPSPSPF